MRSQVGYSAEQDSAIRNMYAAGHTDAQIGAHLGLTKGQVVGRRHRLQGKKFKSDSPRVRIKPPKPEPVIPAAAPAEMIEFKRGPGRTEVKQTLSAKPVHIPLPVPTPMGWRHPRGCQWHMGREGLTHLFCGEPASAGSWCSAHAKIVFMPRKSAAGGLPNAA